MNFPKNKIPTFVPMIRKLLTFMMLAIVLVSRIGIPVYSHVCHDLAESWTSLYLPANACCSWTFQQSGHGCCTTTEACAETNIAAMPCCENRTDLLSLNTSFLLLTQSLSKDQPDHKVAFDSSLAELLLSAETQSATAEHKPHGPPASHFGRNLLIDNQVFRC